MIAFGGMIRTQEAAHLECVILCLRGVLIQNAFYHAAEGDHAHPVIFPCGPAAALAKAQSASSSLVDQDFTGYA
jgi:hypothetical protein